MRLLLDTCTFLWLVSDSPRLSVTARKLFVDPGNEVFLSSVSGWEIVIKHALGRLPLPAPPDEFVPTQREAHGIEPLPMREESALHVAKLPDRPGDLFDRLLVAQALIEGLTLLTPDPALRQYPVRTAW